MLEQVFAVKDEGLEAIGKWQVPIVTAEPSTAADGDAHHCLLAFLNEKPLKFTQHWVKTVTCAAVSHTPVHTDVHGSAVLPATRLAP